MPPEMPTTKLNKLEAAIVRGEDSAEDARWAQAREVVRLLDAEGMTQRDVAVSWINLRRGKPYTQTHVKIVAQVGRRFEKLAVQDRPRWTDAYETVQQGSDEIVAPFDRQSRQREAQAPTTTESAEKLVQNLIKKAPESVKNTIRRGLIEDTQGKYVPPVERKARRAAADDAVQPLKDAVIGGFGKIEAVSLLEQYTEVLREMIEERVLDRERMEAIDAAFELARQETEVARAMVGLETR